MTAWTSGYVTDLGYTHGFYRELTPALLNFVALAKGQRGLDLGGGLDYCELGCGQGFSMNLLASANPQVRFHATDFNPSQIAGARALAAEAGLTNVTFYENSFADFADHPGLPESFDVISLHGIYSWISEGNRAAIVEFIRRKLRAGGLVYISYNTLPGWAAAAPMRHLMYLHGKAKGGPTISRLGPALAFVDQMQQSGAAFFRANPGMKERFERLKVMNRNYLAHEYLNDAWTLLYHSDVAQELSAAKLTYLGSAALLDHVDAVNLTPEQQQIMAGIDDPVLRETMRDYMVNQQFRRDVFVKGGLPAPNRVLVETWLDLRLALSTNRADVPLTVRGALGEANLSPEVYNPILDALKEMPKTLRELMTNSTIAGFGWERIRQALTMLVGAGHLQPCLSAKDEGKRARTTKSFNQAVMQRAQDSGELLFLASPVTGGGLVVDRLQQLFLKAMEEGRKQPEDWAGAAWPVLASQGQRIVKEGKPLENPEDNLAELTTQARAFAEKQLPVLRSLQVA